MRKLPFTMLCVAILLACCTLFVHFSFQYQKDQGDTSLEDILFAQRNRQNILKSTCIQNNLTKSSWNLDPLVASQIFVEETHKLLYCEVPKVGCSNWKRIIFLLKMKMNLKADYLEHNAIHNRDILKRLSDYPKEQQKNMLKTYIKVMFSRDPFQRLVSAYRDKFFHAVGYHGIELPRIIKERFRKNKNTTDNVHFDEFVQYLVHEKPPQMDVHWRPMNYLCDPCNINYDILGKLETVKTDSDYVLKAIGAPPTLKYPEIKQYKDSRTDTKTTGEYFAKLSLKLIEQLVEIYSLDFALFDYS